MFEKIKFLFVFALFVAFMMPHTVTAQLGQIPRIPGDVNIDGVCDATDVYLAYGEYRDSQIPFNPDPSPEFMVAVDTYPACIDLGGAHVPQFDNELTLEDVEKIASAAGLQDYSPYLGDYWLFPNPEITFGNLEPDEPELELAWQWGAHLELFLDTGAASGELATYQIIIRFPSGVDVVSIDTLVEASECDLLSSEASWNVFNEEQASITCLNLTDPIAGGVHHLMTITIRSYFEEPGYYIEADALDQMDVEIDEADYSVTIDPFQAELVDLTATCDN